MTSIKLEKNLEYRNLQESIRYENLTEYYLCKEISLYVLLYYEQHYASTK